MAVHSVSERLTSIAPMAAAAPVRHARGAAALSEESTRRVLENLGVAILVLEEDLRVSMVNAEFERIIGCRREEVLGTTRWMEFITAGSSNAEALKCIAPSGDTAEIEARLRDRHGIEKVIALKIGTIPGTNQCILAFFDIDVTERKLAEEALRQTEKHLREENVLLRSSLHERYRFESIIGRSAAMQRVYELILNAAATDANVIIYGESGTGKELVARAIHETSGRKSGSFVPVNCGAIPESLMESEFFGHRKGAFTGAIIDKHGFLDLANGGTLFLDELGELGQTMQVKLLRVIDGGGYTPIGDSQVRMPDVRIVAATNRDVAEQVRNGVVREDFFYRIHVIPIHLPPLRERKEDIPMLVDHFVEKFGQGKNLPPVTPRIVEMLKAHDWPGNVRELQNTVYRYLTLKTLEFAGAVRRPPDEMRHGGLPETPAGAGNLESMVESYEKHLILKALAHERWQRERTADALGIHRKTLFTKMKKHGLSIEGA
jgi:PAS domain S-box-containing protein